MVKGPLVLRLLPAAGASALLAFVLLTHKLPAAARTIAIGCLVLAWLAPFVFDRAEVRAHASAVTAIAVLTAAGQTDAGVPYGIGCALVLLACFVTMQRARRAPTAPLGTPRAAFSWGAAGWIVLVGGVASSALLLGLPRLAARIEQRITQLLGGTGDEETAFSTTMVLGSTRGMLQRPTVVMRIEGEQPEYLRGAVYDRYQGRYWTTSTVGRDRTTVKDTPNQGTTRITLARGTANGPDMRWFLPAEACDLATHWGKTEIDGFGIARRGSGPDPQVIAYRTTGCVTSSAVAAPGPNDLDVPAGLVPTLLQVGSEWTRDATTTRGRLDGIRHGLASYTYSLAVERDPGLDPVVDFLTKSRAGHCELFASAMVLLARTQGIPARLVGGYRVSEHNPLTGKSVVRERNAHAWIEAWVDGAWRGWDPTPTADGVGPRGSLLDHLGDSLAIAFEQATTTILGLSTLSLAMILSGIAVFGFILREGLRYLRRRQTSTATRATSERPLPCFDALTAALEQAGYPHDPSEPLEAFARRLRTMGETWARAAADAVTRYAEFRYGGLGTEAAVTHDVDEVARAIGRRR